MKRNLLLAAGVLSVLASCKKEETPQPTDPGEKYSVTFVVSNFNTRYEELPGRMTEGLQKDDRYLKYIDFFLYDASGSLVSALTQEEYWMQPEGPYDYGAAHFSLPKVSGRRTPSFISGLIS